MTEEQSNIEKKPKLEFIPFNAINEFMRTDYRMILLRNTMLALPELSPKTQASINKLTKKHVKVPGFRNSAKAPASVKAVSMVKPFEKQPKLVSAVISAWAESNSEMRQQVFRLLSGFGWKLLPVEQDTGSSLLTPEPLMRISVPSSSSTRLVLSSTSAMAEIEASASPLNPRVLMANRSTASLIFDVACLSNAIRASKTDIPQPLSTT